MLALGQQLVQRGHQVTLLGRERMAAQVEATQIEFVNLDEIESSQPDLALYRTSPIRRFLPSRIARMGSGPYAEATGLRAIALSIESYRHWAAFDLGRVPPVLDRLSVDALIASESSLGASTIAEQQKIPFVTISTGLPRHATGLLPPEFTLWPHQDAVWARSRNREIHRFRRLLDIPTLDMLNHVRSNFSLPPYKLLSDTRSPLAMLSQLPPGFEFPVPESEKPVDYLGPLVRSDSREDTPFPWHQLTGDPVIYASAGTLSFGREFFQSIGRACQGLPVQLIATRGGGDFPVLDDSFPENAIIVDYAPQIEILKRASLTITHGSVNTIVESLLHGVPLIAIPLVFDQPGAASRLARTGAGIAMSLKEAKTSRLRSAIQQILQDSEHRSAARRMQETCIAAGGTERGAEIIESKTLARAS